MSRRHRALRSHKEILSPRKNVSDCENGVPQPYNSFTDASPQGFRAVTEGAGWVQCGTADEMILMEGEVWQATFVLVLNGGILPRTTFAVSIGGGVITDPLHITAVEGANEMVFTITNSYRGVFEFSNSPAPSDYTISNLSVRRVDQEGGQEFLNVSAQTSVIKDRWLNSLTLNNVSVFREGRSRVMLFNGSDSSVDCGEPHDLTGDITAVVWVQAYSYGELTSGRVFDNTALSCFVEENNRLGFTSNAVDLAWSAIGSFVLRKWQLISITRTSVGVTNIYINGVIAGAADQDSGIPEAGGDFIIGNSAAGLVTWDGLISDARFLEGILSVEEFSQIFTNEKVKYLL